MGVKIGCCGFAGRRETYFKKYPIIEVEQTFYDPPRVFTAEKWRREAPARFEFAVRAWQLITHPASSPDYRRIQTRLRPHELEAAGHFQPTETVWNGWQRTWEIAVALQARTILFHCPDSFTPTPEHKAHLRQFMHQVRSAAGANPIPFTWAWEPPSSWPAPDIAELSQELGLVHAVDPFVTQPVTPGRCYFRLNGIKGYRHRYSEEELARVGELLEGFDGGFCLFNTLHMREDASRLHWMLRAPKEGTNASNAACDSLQPVS
jgi:uncharacterized protein YecE (DUF72 family)